VGADLAAAMQQRRAAVGALGKAEAHDPPEGAQPGAEEH
jgi:hypothetical protein